MNTAFSQVTLSPDSLEAGEVPCRGTLFFDYDGTLHDTMRLYAPAFRKAYDWLVEQGYAQARQFSDSEIAAWVGWSVSDMWSNFMPELPESTWRNASRIVGEEMDRLLAAGKGGLFPQVEKTLDRLKDDGWTMVFLSNCGPGYRDVHREAFGLDRWFSHYCCVTDYPGLAKWEMYQHMAQQFPKPHIIVGDRFHDIEVALKQGLPSIGCAYGFGAPDELRDATVVVQEFSHIPHAIQEALSEFVGVLKDVHGRPS